MFITFAIIIILPFTGLSSFWIYLALFPIPFAVKASITAIRYGDNHIKMVAALGSNVITVLATDLLIATAIFIELL
jgi:1,4-dihydroxy-2-naphthoate octaprenyltransferase